VPVARCVGAPGGLYESGQAHSLPSPEAHIDELAPVVAAGCNITAVLT